MLATLGYVANWHRMLADVGYWDMFSVPSPLDHAWSLAIEEQFYLVWPLVVLAVLAVARRGRPAADRDGPTGGCSAVAVTGALVSLVLLAVTYDPLDTNRAYFGTDTRLGPTLLGAALAIWSLHRPRREGRPAAGLTAAAIAALAVIGWMCVTVDGLATGLLPGRPAGVHRGLAGGDPGGHGRPGRPAGAGCCRWPR